MEKRYQVFVSSTYTDLKEERHTVIQTLMEMDCIPAGMELFPSIDVDQWDFIQKVIDDCDYYLIIVGGRYGSVTSEGISFTEKEYDYAVSKGIKVIALLRNNLESIPVSKTDSDPEKKEKLNQFINKLKDGRLVKFWNDEKELPGLVALSLNKTIKQYPATGWIRGNQVSNESLLIEIERLRKENTELKNLQNDVQPEIKINNTIKENIANFDDFYCFKGKYLKKGDSTYYDWRRNDSWKNLFTAISPYLLEIPADDDVRKAINQYFLLTTPKNKNIEKIFIMIDSLHTIKIQFMAFGLITNDGISWELTEYGKQEMIKNRVIRKKK